MPGRHDAPIAQRRRLAPTALHAVIACTPATSLVAALALAGGGYLVGREGIAACGAVVGAFGLVVERISSRGVRVRLRRERVRHRGDLRDVSRQLHDVHRALAGLRADLDDVRSERDAVRLERDAVRDELLATLGELAAVRVMPPQTLEPLAPPRPESTVSVEAAVPSLHEAPPLGALPMPPRPLIIPGQVRSAIATGGIPVLPPGPSEPARTVIDLRAVVPAGCDEAPESALGGAERTDALVYAALAVADADELTRCLELGTRGTGPDVGALHTGDAHHAGNYARNDRGAFEAPELYIVRRSRRAA